MDRDVVAYCYALADKWIEDCRKERTKMINDNEGMDNALEYYVDGDNTAYWKEFVRRLDDRLERWAEKKVEEEMQGWKDDYETYDSNVDSDEEYEEEQDYDYDDYYDYDDEWEDFDWDYEE